ncbi:MAG: peptidoglycan bridge formation glycyltransferase FemA/FemB family protein [Anaerolineaceae bacterium]|nr:peptidoglycan bridge formation glycyltransferase FemA/FemB family protein [Anaerolineaceae bacterium]
MTLQIVTPNPEEWDLFVSRQPRAHVLQQAAWGSLKGAYGWDTARVALSDGTTIRAGAQVLFRGLPLRLGTMAYLSMGPYVDEPELWPQFWVALDELSRRHGAAFLKWEPGIYQPGESPPDFAGWGFHESPQTVQPPRTILIDISRDEEAILAGMNQGTRRKIRQSLKNEVQYFEGTQADVATFTAMMQTTGTRNAFGVHEPAYYEKAYELFVPSGDAALILAEHEGDPLAGLMVFAKGATAWYLYGASSNTKRNLMAAYGVQWRAIQWARARGCTVYDMWGVPDADEDTLEAQFQERSDGLWGVYGFKRGWGGEVVRSAGAWDKVYNPLVYNAYKLALRVRG